MIHVVTQHNRAFYRDALAEMHRLRRVHFVEERGWAAMTVRDGGEYDQFDDDKTVYLLAIEPDGSVSCSMRMRPAETGSVLGDVFPHLVADDEPSIYRPEVWEISRYFAAANARGRGGARRRAEIRLASLEVALARGVKRLVGMIDLEMLPPMLNGSGWRVRPLGLPAPYDEGVAQAIEVSVSRPALAEMEEMTGLEGPITLEIDTARVPVELPPQDLEVLLEVGRGRGDRARLAVAVARRIVELQDEMDEEHLLGVVAYVQAIVSGEDQLQLN